MRCKPRFCGYCPPPVSVKVTHPWLLIMSARAAVLTSLLQKRPQAPKKAKKRADGAGSNVFSMFEQARIQEFKEVSAPPQMFVLEQLHADAECDTKPSAGFHHHGSEQRRFHRQE